MVSSPQQTVLQGAQKKLRQVTHSIFIQIARLMLGLDLTLVALLSLGGVCTAAVAATSETAVEAVVQGTPPTTEAEPKKTIVKIPPKQSEADASQAYIKAVLQLALDESAASYGPAEIAELQLTYNQKLILSLLNHKGILDVVGSAPTPEREIDFRSARVPLMMGLLGYRMLIIRQSNRSLFKAIKTSDQLKPLKSCQGEHWPDATIMAFNGYQVETDPEFEQLFKKLANGECDYFPRGITEGYAEINAYSQAHPEHKLTVFDDILLHYKQPFLFYTSHANFELAARIEKGLITAVENKKLRTLMQQHPVTKHVFPLSQWSDKTIFELSNPWLPKSLPHEKPQFWIDLTTGK